MDLFQLADGRQAMTEIIFKPIGRVRAQFADSDVRAEDKDLEGELEIYAEFEAGLEGIDGYSHLFVLAYFDRLRPDQIEALRPAFVTR